MSYVDAIRRQAEDAPRASLPAVTVALWRAFAEGHVSEAEAEALSALIETRQAAFNLRGIVPLQDCLRTPPRAVGSRPRTDASMERRRRWAASGRLPPGLAARFTLAEQAALALIAAETARRGDCRLSIPHLAAVAGVAETTVRNAIREARKFGLLTVEERRLTGYRNDTNIVRIVSPEWTGWLRLGRKGGGCKSPNRTPTQVPNTGKTRIAGPTKGYRESAGAAVSRSNISPKRQEGPWSPLAGGGQQA